MNQKRFNTDEDMDILLKIKADVDNKLISLRQAAEFLNAKTGKTISHEGLRKIFHRVNEQNGRNQEAPTLGTVS
jgi:benzoyl-CoA reductase/2-hydroxyglutaryl-CoA dehydratase subunit BcrC/BadD/HgdB